MADKKISQLPSASIPLAGTEVLPIVQSGATDQVSVENLTAGRSISCTGITTTGNGARIIGDMSSGTIANRLMFQTSITNNATALELIPNGTRSSGNPATQVVLEDANSVATGNGSIAVIGNIQDTEFRIQASIRGTGTYLPISFYTNNVKQWILDTNGNYVQQVAAKGINFTANTAAAGMTSQLLNWYEQGTFTSTIVGTTTAGVGTYTAQTGIYTRIGNQVSYAIYIVLTAHTGTGNMRIGGLPFTANAGNYYPTASIRVSNLAMTAGNYAQAYVLSGTTTLALEQVPTGGGAAVAIPMDTACEILVSGVYFV